MTTVDFEGPPTAFDMKGIARDLLHAGKFERAWRLAETMLDYWQSDAPDRHGGDGMLSFGWWLGISDAAYEAQRGQDRRRDVRAERKYQRLLMGRSVKPAKVPAARRRGAA